MYGRHGGDVRIAIVAESYEPSAGTTTDCVRQLLGELGALHDLLVIAPGRGPATSAGAPVVRVSAITAPWRYQSPRVGLPMVPRMEWILRDFAPDAVLLVAPAVLGAAAALAARRAGIPSVAVLSSGIAAFAERHLRNRRSIDRRSMVAWDWLRRVHGLVDRTLVPCEAARTALAERGFGGLAIWPQAVDLTEYSPGQRDDSLRAALGAPGRVLVGYVGSATSEQRVDLLPSVAALPDVRLVVAGSGAATSRLRRLTPSAAHLGTTTDDSAAAVVASLDVLVSPGVGSTAARSILQALAAGVPVVAAASGPSADLVRHGHNGILVAPGSARALALAVGSLSRDAACRAVLAARARPSVEDRSWQALGLELLVHLRGVAGRPVVRALTARDRVAA